MADKQITAFLAGVVGVVDANSYEDMCLWKENTERGRSWEQARGGGLIETVGHLADMPVCLSLLINIVDGHRLLFIDPTSAVVDHRLIDEWLKETMPVTAFEDNDPRKRLNRTNAMNFSNVLPRAQAKGEGQ